jgi:hypothetical protein
MSEFRLWPVVLALGAAVTTPIHAAESMAGRWARDDAACSATAAKLLIVSDTALRWGEEVCRLGRQYRTGDTLHLEAFCDGEQGKRTIPVSLRLAGHRIVVTWNRAARGELRRCPNESKP